MLLDSNKSVLLKFDEIGRHETPSTFNYSALVAQTGKLKARLEELFGHQLILDDQVQDASHYCDILIPSQFIATCFSNQLYAIRISNFGRLATIIRENHYLEGIESTIVQALSENGFLLLKAEDLDKEYDGVFTKFHHLSSEWKVTWRTRYFDYL